MPLDSLARLRGFKAVAAKPRSFLRSRWEPQDVESHGLFDEGPVETGTNHVVSELVQLAVCHPGVIARCSSPRGRELPLLFFCSYRCSEEAMSMPATDDRDAAFRAHVERVQGEFRDLKLSEADTRSYLIDPVLSLLGYQGVSHLRREVPIPETKEFVDYVLLLDGKPHAIVEAKRKQHALTAQHAAQCVQYAAVLGVRWCLITNGVVWELYDAYAKATLAEKQVTNVRLDGDAASTEHAGRCCRCSPAPRRPPRVR